MGVGGRHTLAALLPGKTRYPLYKRLGGPQGRSGWVRKISPPPGFDPRTFQPVVSRCTDYAIPAHIKCITVQYSVFVIKNNHWGHSFFFLQEHGNYLHSSIAVKDAVIYLISLSVHNVDVISILGYCCCHVHLCGCTDLV
jgi:hypothetical protein